MAISDRAKEITEEIYVLYGTGTGWLFGIDPRFKQGIYAIVQATLDFDIVQATLDFDKED